MSREVRVYWDDDEGEDGPGWGPGWYWEAESVGDKTQDLAFIEGPFTSPEVAAASAREFFGELFGVVIEIREGAG